MRNKRGMLLTSCLIFCLVTIHSFAASKRTPTTRILFKRGESSATVTGKLTSRRLKQTFVIRAKAGQHLYAGIKPLTSDEVDYATFIVLNPSGEPIADENDGRVQLKQTGDYRIEVTPPGSFYREDLRGYKELRFKLSVKIE
jgi:hypothetical protein